MFKLERKNVNLVSIKDIYWHSVADMKLQRLNPGATYLTEQQLASAKLVTFLSCMTCKESREW